jgi:hypothetical protein
MKPDMTVEQRARAQRILESIRHAIATEAGGDPLLEFAIRRYIYVRLSYDERGKPMQRRKLKVKLFDRQQGRSPLCGESIVTLSGTELHRGPSFCRILGRERLFGSSRLPSQAASRTELHLALVGPRLAVRGRH